MSAGAAPLAGRVALVTGAGRGIGRAIAIGYARAGASVACAARTHAEIEATAAKIEKIRAGAALAVETDVTRPESVEGMVAACEDRFGALHLLVLAAGVDLDRETVGRSDPDAWRATIEVNLTGAYLCARAAIPLLRRSGGGKILTVGSGLGHRGIPARSAYACSKAGLWMLTRVLAQELAADGIAVNELIPGPVRTSLAPPGEMREFAGRFPSEWVKDPEDVVPLALFLAAGAEPGPSAQSFSLMRRDG